jgi:hypothetical protein
MADPTYGTGPYGVGPYGTAPEPFEYEFGGETAIRFQPVATLSRQVAFGGATQIAFDLRGAFVESWEPIGPCEIGEWSIAA